MIFSLLLLFAYPAQPLAQSLENLGFESRLSVAGTLAAEAEGQRTGLLEGAIAQRKNFEARTGVSFGIDNQIQYLGTNSGKKPWRTPLVRRSRGSRSTPVFFGT